MVEKINECTSCWNCIAYFPLATSIPPYYCSEKCRQEYDVKYREMIAGECEAFDILKELNKNNNCN